jgi:hypothetical protein
MLEFKGVMLDRKSYRPPAYRPVSLSGILDANSSEKVLGASPVERCLGC